MLNLSIFNIVIVSRISLNTAKNTFKYIYSNMDVTSFISLWRMASFW